MVIEVWPQTTAEDARVAWSRVSLEKSLKNDLPWYSRVHRNRDGDAGDGVAYLFGHLQSGQETTRSGAVLVTQPFQIDARRPAIDDAPRSADHDAIGLVGAAQH